MAKIIDGIEFPKRFNCECGSSRRIAETIINDEKKKGIISEGFPAGTEAKNILVLDPSKPLLRATTIIVLKDICADCGREYIYMVDCGDVPITASFKGRIPNTGNSPLPPGFILGRG